MTISLIALKGAWNHGSAVNDSCDGAYRGGGFGGVGTGQQEAENCEHLKDTMGEFMGLLHFSLQV